VGDRRAGALEAAILAAVLLSAGGCAARAPSRQAVVVPARADLLLVRQGCHLCLPEAASGLGQRVSAAPAPSAAGAQPGTVGVIFSSPDNDEAGVSLSAPIRLRFSADLDASTLDGQLALAYSAEDSRERGEPEPPAIAFTFEYDGAGRALTIRPTKHWERFREVQLTLGTGVRGAAGEHLQPFALTFTTGGS